jgi:tRNA dimethylallyltransferase
VNNLQLPLALYLMGPTASGKSALAVTIAQHFNCEIISVDSALVYRGMDIGTAKPSSQERGGINHHLIDILDPAQAYSTAQFRDQALELMADISHRGKIPLLTGGTMLYFHALFNGLVTLPEADQVLRERLDAQAERTSWQQMHQRLQQIDPQSAARIHPNDPQRIQRALEVYELTGKALSLHFAEAEQEPIPYRNIKIIIAPGNRAVLHENIALRFQQMLKQGLLEEVEKLYQRPDLSEQLPAIRAVGYRQAWQYLDGLFDYQIMTDKAIVATRQLAKRQFTWLRKIEDGCWYDTETEDLQAKILDNLAKIII